MREDRGKGRPRAGLPFMEEVAHQLLGNHQERGGSGEFCHLWVFLRERGTTWRRRSQKLRPLAVTAPAIAEITACCRRLRLEGESKTDRERWQQKERLR